jgi:hypothetical protein
MDQRQIVGWVLIVSGLMDVAVALFVVGPRLPEARRGVVQKALFVGALVMFALGGSFLAGVF